MHDEITLTGCGHHRKKVWFWPSNIRGQVQEDDTMNKRGKIGDTVGKHGIREVVEVLVDFGA
jgi:hypothetical protein